MTYSSARMCARTMRSYTPSSMSRLGIWKCSMSSVRPARGEPSSPGRGTARWLWTMSYATSAAADEVALGLDRHPLRPEEHRLHAPPGEEHGEAVDELVQSPTPFSVPPTLESWSGISMIPVICSPYGLMVTRKRPDSSSPCLDDDSTARPASTIARWSLPQPSSIGAGRHPDQVALDDFLDVVQVHLLAVGADGQNCCLVDQRRQGRAAVPVGELRGAVQ